jgi:polyisoprenoid-binding protein YceI
LRSADFFNVEKFPEITFTGTSFKMLGNGMYKLTGDFTMNGVTKSITLDVKNAGTIKDPYGNTRTGFKLTGTIDRTLWGLKYNSVMDAGGITIGNDIAIACYVELIKQK